MNSSFRERLGVDMCDTFIALPHFTGGTIIFGKNSDREPNEAQALEYHPGRTHPPGATVQTTYLEIPQVKETCAVLLCRPFWMWGAEMGANERGVVIGNEAVFTRMPARKDPGLTGMDMLRLALERSRSAADAMENIIQLLADYGQGGVCGFEDKKMVYHNSFIIADPGEAWVLETAGFLWAAQRIRDVYAISNGLTIGEAFDTHHADLHRVAREKGWLKKGRPLHFSDCFSNPILRFFTACRTRRSRVLQLLNNKKNHLTAGDAMAILRDHGEAAYRPDTHLLIDRVCAHAANRLTRNAAQTTGSMVASLTSEEQVYWATGTAAPCLSIFKPIWLNGNPLPDMGPAPEGVFEPRRLWWFHEQLHRSVLEDYPVRAAGCQTERDAFEAHLQERAGSVPPDHRGDLTRTAFQRAHAKTAKWIQQVRDLPVKRPAGWFYRRYWRGQNNTAGLIDRLNPTET